MADRQNTAQTLLKCIVQSTYDADLHVLPASPMLEGAERELMGFAGAPYRLADPLSRILNRYAAIVIDTRPSHGFRPSGAADLARLTVIRHRFQYEMPRHIGGGESEMLRQCLDLSAFPVRQPDREDSFACHLPNR